MAQEMQEDRIFRSEALNLRYEKSLGKAKELTEKIKNSRRLREAGTFLKERIKKNQEKSCLLNKVLLQKMMVK